MKTNKEASWGLKVIFLKFSVFVLNPQAFSVVYDDRTSN